MTRFSAHLGSTASAEPSFTFGIEEEYFLVDLTSRAPLPADQRGLMQAFEAALGEQVAREFMGSQVEINTSVCSTLKEARSELTRLRGALCELARERGVALLAAATHPFARWDDQSVTERHRYREIARDLAGVGRRLNTCGMHVHVAIEDDDLRVHIMNEVRDFLPLLLALSASSPFWQGDDTGLKSYRLAVTDAQPRSGLPESFASWSDYQRTVGALSRSGAVEDASKIWWDLRPSSRFPTLEMRITDVCTRTEDALTIAALFVCLCRALCRMRRAGLTWHAYPLLLLNENRWRAQRYGVRGSLIDFAEARLIPCAELADRLIGLVEQDAEALDCTEEVQRARTIALHGTSADRQLARHRELIQAGATAQQALSLVVDQLIEETCA
jgi:glutamate---cysteine ligase / carboxylate-amine ligase